MNRKWIILLLLFLSTIAFAQNKTYLAAKMHYDKAQYTQALSLLNTIKPSDGTDFNTLLLKGDCLQKEEKFDSATSVYRNAAKLKPKSSILYANWSAALYNLKQFENAERKAKKALKLDPELPQANYFMGNLKFHNFKLSAALRYYNKALKLRPDYRDALYMRAATHAELKNYKKALRDYKAVLKIDPDLEVARYNIGVIELATGSYEAAHETFATLDPEKLPNAVDYYYYKAEALYFDGKIEEACGWYKKAADLGDSESADIYQRYCINKEKRKPELKTRTIRATF